jgi:hypothetical protein
MRAASLIAVGLLAAACATGGRVPAGAPGRGGPESERALPVPADLAPRIQAASELGRILYMHDKASAIGTDVMRANVPDAANRGLGGWLTFRSIDGNGKLADSFSVAFITREEPYRTLFRVEVPLQGRPTFQEISPPAALNELGVQMFRARQTAIKAVPRGRRRWNPVILPGSVVDRPDAILVYLLAAEYVSGEMVFGIHYRVLVSGDGTTVQEVMPLSKSDLVVSPPGKDAAPPGAVLVANMVSQIVTDWPLETHVFVSLLHGKAPIYVVTRRGTWLVIGDKITLVDDKPPLPKS